MLSFRAKLVRLDQRVVMACKDLQDSPDLLDQMGRKVLTATKENWVLLVNLDLKEARVILAHQVLRE